METGTIIRSDNFHTPSYWVVKCNNPNLPGNRYGELPIDEAHFPSNDKKEGKQVQFELVELGDVENYKWYARIKQ